MLNYNPATGVLTRIKGIKGTKAGDIIRCPNGDGYYRISILGTRYFAHRVAWFYVYGAWPIKIDHINHIKTDNRIENLRSVSHHQNMQNISISKTNKSGFNGVDKHKNSGKWRARIPFNGKEVHLGLFDNLDDAIESRKMANIKYGFHDNHGK